MDRWLAAGELDRFRLALGGDERVEHRLDLREAEREPVSPRPGSRVGKADRAVEVAGGVDLDDPQTGVLGVLGADPAVVRAAVARPRSGARAARFRACRSAGCRGSGRRRRRRPPRSGRGRGTSGSAPPCRPARAVRPRAAACSAGRSTRYDRAIRPVPAVCSCMAGVLTAPLPSGSVRHSDADPPATYAVPRIWQMPSS